MTANIVATEEIRDALWLAGEPRTVAWLADDLAVSASTVRRHLAVLVQRGQVDAEPNGGRAATYRLTPSGRRAAETNEGL